MINLTPLINAFIAVMATLAVRYLVPWLKERTTAEQREDLAYWVKVAVEAAEQIFDSTQGEKKKDYVLRFLEIKGFNIEYSEINLAIESAVLELHKELSNG